MTRTLVTSALPYANGSIHLGHLVEYVQTDIYVRFLRSCGEEAIYLCADDTHGTPIEIKARQMGISPEALVAGIGEEHRRDFGGFDISFDHFDSTNSDENRAFVEQIFDRLLKAGHIEKRPLELNYCEKDRRFLPDRFVLGTCPKCGAPDQYGDVCEKCGATYAPTELKEARCALCSTAPVRRSSDHYFFRLEHFAEFLNEWSATPGVLDPAVRNNLMGGWLGTGLADWCVSRDSPYFGFLIPGEQEKYFYVWMDAPIGYIGTTERFLAGRGGKALDYWAQEADARIVHVIGKDILNFHALFWPALLRGAELKVPSQLVVHGMLTINGSKMSKARGTFITARQYLDLLDPSYLRYFYAANLGPSPEDLDLSLKEFRLKVNAELVNNLGNLCNRSLSILATRLEGRLSAQRDEALLADARSVAGVARAAFSRLEYRAALRAIVELGERINKFIQDTRPWEKVASAPEEARRDLSTVAEIAWMIAGMLAPVVPRFSEALCEQLGVAAPSYKELTSGAPSSFPKVHTIGTPKPLIARLEEAIVSKLVVTQAPPAEVAPSKKTAPPSAAPASNDATVAKAEGLATYDDFCKIELRVGQVLHAERVPKSDKLLKLSVDLGEGIPRTIAAGIAEAVAPEQLVGRRVAVVANLAPRTIRGIESRGMLLAAGEPGKGFALLDVPGELVPGSVIR